MNDKPRRMYVIKAEDIKHELGKAIANAEANKYNVAFISLKAQHPLHETLLGRIMRQVLTETNSRQGRDWLIRQAQENRYIAILGCDWDYAARILSQVRSRCEGLKIKSSGELVSMPKRGTLEEKAESVYEGLTSLATDSSQQYE